MLKTENEQNADLEVSSPAGKYRALRNNYLEALPNTINWPNFFRTGEFKKYEVSLSSNFNRILLL